MKKTYAQFTAIFVGVLVMHIVVATALMNSAETEEPGSPAASVDPTYHFSPDRSPSPDPPTPGESDESQPAPASETSIPDAFAEGDGGKTAPESGAVPPPPIPKKSEPASPAETPTRRLTVNQLLAGDSNSPKVKPLVDSKKADAPEESPTPRIKSLPPVETAPEAGPRKVRSLTGN